MLKRVLLFSLGLAAGLAVAIFIARNRAAVNVNWYWGSSGEVPVWAVVLGAFALGNAVPVLLYFATSIEGWFDRRRLLRRMEELEQELVALRNLPLAEAQIDIDNPRRLRPLQASTRAPMALEPEVLPATEAIKEADLYPAVYESTKA